MTDILNKTVVLVLNRHWQAIDMRTPVEAFSMLASGAATALDMKPNEYMEPVKWQDWLLLPVRDGDFSIGTVRGQVRVPTVVVLARFDKVPKRRPKFCSRAIWERDGGVCQYTGRKLKPSEGNIDHIVPRSRGGKTNWENCVLADKRINSRKGNRTPEEVGLRLVRPPFIPREVPSTALIKNLHEVPDWNVFIAEDKAGRVEIG
jgi:5-methylcytosine-specific restriction endonuclease McrA